MKGAGPRSRSIERRLLDLWRRLDAAAAIDDLEGRYAAACAAFVKSQ